MEFEYFLLVFDFKFICVPLDSVDRKISASKIETSDVEEIPVPSAHLQKVKTRATICIPVTHNEFPDGPQTISIWKLVLSGAWPPLQMMWAEMETTRVELGVVLHCSPSHLFFEGFIWEACLGCPKTGLYSWSRLDSWGASVNAEAHESWPRRD